MKEPAVARETGAATVATAAVAGAVAAVAGAILWGLVVRWSGYEIGVAAWAIGFVVGSAVVLGGGGRRGITLQVLSVALAVAGVVLGKYLAFVWGFNEEAKDLGLPVRLSLLSRDTLDFFVDRDSEVWGWFDLVWLAFAVYTAYRIPRPPEAAPRPADERPADDRR